MASRPKSVPRDEPLPDAEVHSEGFRQTREARRSALVEDYVELIADLIEDGKAQVKMLHSHDKWYGVTYREDKPGVVAALARLTAEGVYPEKF